MGDGGGGHCSVQMEWHPAGWSAYLPLLIFPCTTKSPNFSSGTGSPGWSWKRAVKWLYVCVTAIFQLNLHSLILHFSSSISPRKEPSEISKKGKEFHTQWGVLAGCSSPLLRTWARRWINHSSLWCMASATPDLRLPSQPQDIAVPRLVPNCTAW